MGCDIHVYAEIKVKDVPGWHYYGQVPMNRNYDLFRRIARLPGESQSVTPISEPRDWPAAVSLVANLHRQDWGSDGHSHTYLSSQEVIDLYDWAIAALNYPQYWIGESYLFGTSWHTFRKFPDDYPEFVEDFRWLILFDN